LDLGYYLFVLRRHFFAKINFQSEGAAEGGCGGNSAAPERSAGAPARRSLGAGGKRRRSVVRIGLVKSSDFIQEGQPVRTSLKGCLAASPLGIEFGEDLPVIFERNRNRPLPQKGVRHCEAMINKVYGRLFVSPSATSKAIIFIPKAT